MSSETLLGETGLEELLSLTEYNDEGCTEHEDPCAPALLNSWAAKMESKYKIHMFFLILSQQSFTCSKSTLETLEKGVKYVQVNKKKKQERFHDVVLVFLLLTLLFWYLYCWLLTLFTPFSSVSIINFEQVKICWDNAGSHQS